MKTALLLLTAVPVFATAPTSANLWVDSNGGTCTRQSTAGAYVDAQACSTIDAAWDAASVGDVIVMKAATYSGTQTISGNKTTPGAHVYGEATTTIGLLHINANFFVIEDVTVDSGATHSDGVDISGTDVTFINVKLHGQYSAFNIDGQPFPWQGGELGASGATPGLRDFCGTDAEPVNMSNVNSSNDLPG
jgi:hypothetical protein